MGEEEGDRRRKEGLRIRCELDGHLRRGERSGYVSLLAYFAAGKYYIRASSSGIDGKVGFDPAPLAVHNGGRVWGAWKGLWC